MTKHERPRDMKLKRMTRRDTREYGEQDLELYKNLLVDSLRLSLELRSQGFTVSLSI